MSATATAIIIPVVAFFGYKWLYRTGLLQDGKKSFTFYYMTGCGHCKKMYPDVTALGYKYNNILIRWIEANSNNEIEVDGFPTLIYRDEKGNLETYKGDRTAIAMRQFLDSK